jgi:hypothetical protein
METYTTYELNQSRSDVNRIFGLLCIELKHLYVSITRPKQRLLIYETDERSRREIT